MAQEMNLEKILKVAVLGEASDIILQPGVFPRFRFHSEIMNLADGDVINPQLMLEWIGIMVPPHLKTR